MGRNWGFALALLGCLALGSCNSGGNTNTTATEPTGQVVATVAGQEITLRELRAELGTPPTDPKAAKTAEQTALRAIIGRKILASAAREQGLDKTPDFALQQLRTMDLLMVQTLQAKIATDMPQPAPEEVDRYIADHRDVFAERKIFDLDQITLTRPTDPEKLKAFEPLKTMAEVETMLKREQIDYRHIVNAVLDSVGANPQLIERILKLPPNEVFVLPAGGNLLVNQIRQTRVVPFTGEPARNYALGLLRNQHLQETMQRALSAIMAKAQSSIKYNKAYAPPPAAPAEGAPAAKSDGENGEPAPKSDVQPAESLPGNQAPGSGNAPVGAKAG
jgi:EpsD family peptidyl-prolyl cis-trans isomerase